jgi:hypothetical protein
MKVHEKMHENEKMHESGEQHEGGEMHKSEEVHESGEMHESEKVHEKMHESGEMHDNEHSPFESQDLFDDSGYFSDEDINLNENEEVYNINFSFNNISYGSNRHTCTLYSLENDCPVSLIEGFSDSVVYSKQLEENLILVCTIDGTISLLSHDQIIQSEKIEEDITFVEVIKDKIFIGGSLGSIYVFNLDLSSQNVYLGHGSDIHKIFYSNSTIYSLSDTQFIAFDEFSFQQKYKKNFKEAKIFESFGENQEIFCIGKEGEVVILKNGFILHKFPVQGIPECILFAYDHFIVGGSFPFLILINTKLNWREYKLNLKIEGSTKIQKVNDFKIAISTMCGLVGIGDIRKDDSFEFKESGVGSVFDFQFIKGKFYVGGAFGFDVVQ